MQHLIKCPCGSSFFSRDRERTLCKSCSEPARKPKRKQSAEQEKSKKKRESRFAWTDKEVETVRIMWAQGKRKEEVAAVLPGRSPGSIATFASKTKLKRDDEHKLVEDYRAWTKSELKILKQYWFAGKKAGEIAHKLDRSKGAVYMKTYQLWGGSRNLKLAMSTRNCINCNAEFTSFGRGKFICETCMALD